ncbi:MAG: VOC family protein [Deltaproteobacteria bacterium]|nr:VOC family protein [Deltaproteobacteria bacterium]
MTIAAVHHIALRTDDLQILTEYYRDRLGLSEHSRKLDEHGVLRAVWLVLGSAVLMIEKRGAHEPTIPANSLELLAFSVATEALDAWAERLAPLESRTAFTLYARDPDGRRVAVSCYPLTG